MKNYNTVFSTDDLNWKFSKQKVPQSSAKMRGKEKRKTERDKYKVKKNFFWQTRVFLFLDFMPASELFHSDMPCLSNNSNVQRLTFTKVFIIFRSPVNHAVQYAITLKKLRCYKYTISISSYKRCTSHEIELIVTIFLMGIKAYLSPLKYTDRAKKKKFF